MTCAPPHTPKFSHRWPQHARAMKLPIERTRPLTLDSGHALAPDDWVDDDALEGVAVRRGGFFTTTEQAGWKRPYTSSPYELPCALYLCRPLTFYKTVDPSAGAIELPLLPLGRIIIPFHGSTGKDSSYGREWCWMGLPTQAVEAIRTHLAERGVAFAADEAVKGQQVRPYHDQWWTLFQARFDECKILDTSGLARSSKMGLQYVLQQAKADLFAAVAFEVRLTYGGEEREYGEWKTTKMHLHFTPRLVCVTGPAHSPRPPSYNESKEHLLSPSVYSMHSIPSSNDLK